MCLGAGLFIFLWAITDSFGHGVVGLLILFTGRHGLSPVTNAPLTNRNETTQRYIVSRTGRVQNTVAFDQLVQKYQSPIRRFFLNLTCGDSEL